MWDPRRNDLIFSLSKASHPAMTAASVMTIAVPRCSSFAYTEAYNFLVLGHEGLD